MDPHCDSWKPKVFLLPARPHPWDRTAVPWGPCASWCPWTPWTLSPAEPWIPWAPPPAQRRVSPKLGWFHLLVATLRGKKNKKDAPMAIIGISPHKSQIYLSGKVHLVISYHWLFAPFCIILVKVDSAQFAQPSPPRSRRPDRQGMVPGNWKNHLWRCFKPVNWWL